MGPFALSDLFLDNIRTETWTEHDIYFIPSLIETFFSFATDCLDSSFIQNFSLYLFHKFHN